MKILTFLLLGNVGGSSAGAGKFSLGMGGFGCYYHYCGFGFRHPQNDLEIL